MKWLMALLVLVNEHSFDKQEQPSVSKWQSQLRVLTRIYSSIFIPQKTFIQCTGLSSSYALIPQDTL